MCGIFGLISGRVGESGLSLSDYQQTLRRLFLLSESRGKEAAGLAYMTEGDIRILRKAISASSFLKSVDYQEIQAELIKDFPLTGSTAPLATIGHARLVTNGLQGIDANNQPVRVGEVVCVHNGIIVNERDLWAKYSHLNRTADVDTEVIAARMNDLISAGAWPAQACSDIFAEIYGEASIATLHAQHDQVLLATNTGSLYIAHNANKQFAFFCSEKSVARQVTASLTQALQAGIEITQIRAGTGVLINVKDAVVSAPFSWGRSEVPTGHVATSLRAGTPRCIRSHHDKVVERWLNMRRCTNCVLPETMPFIRFDDKGVCNYCRNHVERKMRGRDALEQELAKYRRGNGEPDCIVSFSGGRDSSYGLHMLVKEFGMTPLTFTYDWGMVTDLARRNQARLCGKLGVEHIWVSADIRQKRRNVRQNVEAWLKKPNLGMVPLFMAGDKQFMYHANRVMKETNIKLMVYSTNHFERTDFKVGFCGVRPASAEIQLHKISMMKKIQLVSYYLKNYLANPGYFNSSLTDTFTAFLSYYFVNQDFLYLFDYVDWDESVINKTLIGDYDWELALDTKTTWRIGDGTAPFYNYIYSTVAGFSEYETFRSNQIRAGVMDREEALRLIREENVARIGSIQEYCRMIGVDFDHAMGVIDNIPKMY